MKDFAMTYPLCFGVLLIVLSMVFADLVYEIVKKIVR